MASVPAVVAQAVARFFALQWHQDGLAPYIVFEGRQGHGDLAVQAAQDWIARHVSVANPLEGMIRRSGLTGCTFKRRFTSATGLSPIAYVPRLRIGDAKRRLERTEASVDEISWQVGYEEPAFFRRLFERVTGLAPGAYRRRFKVPDYARPHPNAQGQVLPSGVLPVEASGVDQGARCGLNPALGARARRATIGSRTGSRPAASAPRLR